MFRSALRATPAFRAGLAPHHITTPLHSSTKQDQIDFIPTPTPTPTTMFRSALRATPAFRAGLAPRLTQVNARAMSSATHAHQPQKGKVRTFLAQIPVDV
jgi:GrpB-like predicted nucleotidyltransferase (UPF0157 family)